MKLIPKYLQGGYTLYFSTYQPVFAETRSARKEEKTEKKEDKSKSELTEKDLFSMLKDLDGLPNEVNALARSLSNTLQMSTIFGSSTTDLARQYISALSKLRVAKFNKEQYDNAYKEAEKNGALNDIAITTSGQVVVLTKDGELSTITPQQLLSSEGEYAPVTNSNLLWLRAHDPSFVNNNSIFLTIENGIGLDLVHKMIKDRFSKLGSTSITSERYFPKEAVKGVELLEQAIANGPEGFYKWLQSLTLTDQNLLNAALNYIYDTLPHNAKTRLQLETQNGTLGETREIIMQMLVSGINTSTSNTFSFIKDTTNGKNGSGEGTDDLSKIPDTTAQLWLAGQGAQIEYIINPKSHNGIKVRGNGMAVTDHSGNPLPVLSTLTEVSKGEFGTILDFNSVNIGGRHVDSANLGGVAIRGNYIISVDLPCEVTANGEIVPKVNPETVRKMNDIKNDLKSKGIDLDNPDSVKNHYNEVNLAFAAKDLVTPYNSDGSLIESWHRFGIIPVYLDDRIIGSNTLDNFENVKRVTDDATINNLIDAFSDENFSKGRHGFLWLQSPDHMYEGIAYIPVIENTLGALSTVNLNMGQSNIVDKRLQQNNIRLGLINPVHNGIIPQQ